MATNKNPRTSQGAVCVMCHLPRALVMFYTHEHDKNGPVVETEGYCVACTALVIKDRSGLTLREALK